MAEQTYKFEDGSGINSTNQVVRDAQVAPPPVAPATPVDVKTPNIPVEQVKNTQALNLPTPNVDTSSADGMVAGVQAGQKTINDYMKDVETPESENQKTQKALIGSIQSLLPQAGGKQQALADEEEARGVNKLKTDLAGINAQITTRMASYERAFAEQELKTGVPLEVVRGRQAAVRRMQAADIGLLQARALGLQGQVETAMDVAERSINLKYESIEDAINLQMKQLDVIQPLLAEDEKKQSMALSLKIEDDRQRAERAKEQEKQINSIMIEAAKFGADNGTLEKVQKSSSIGEAIAMSSNFLSAEFRQKVEQQRFENNMQMQQLAISRANHALSARRLAMEEAEAQGLGNAQELTAFAQQYASTGQIPAGMPKGSFGLVAAIAKDLPKNKGAIVDRNTGLKPNDPKVGAYTDMYSVVELAKQLKELDAKRPRGITGGAMSWMGESDSKRYIQLKDQIVDLLGKARSGAALSVNEEQKYNGMLPSRFVNPLGFGGNTQSSIDNFINTVSTDLNNKLSAQGMAIYGLSTVEVQGKTYKVGDILTAGDKKGRVNADGSLTLVE